MILKTWAITWSLDVPVAVTSTASSPSPLTKGGRLPSLGLGASLLKKFNNEVMPAPVRADTKQMGTRWPSRRACSNAECNSSRDNSSPSRYFSINSSLTSTTWSMMASCASDSENISVSPSVCSKQSSTLVRFPVGKLIGRHSGPNSSRRSVTTWVRSTSSASMRLMIIMRHRRRCFARRIRRRVASSIPEWALTTMAVVSTAVKLARVGPRKSGIPAVSIRFKCIPW